MEAYIEEREFVDRKIREKVHVDADTPHNKYRFISSSSGFAYPAFKI